MKIPASTPEVCTSDLEHHRNEEECRSSGDDGVDPYHDWADRVGGVGGVGGWGGRWDEFN